VVLLKDSYKFKEIKTLAKRQKAAEMAVTNLGRKQDRRALPRKQNQSGCRFKDLRKLQSGTR
jgi:hypothetical protein